MLAITIRNPYAWVIAETAALTALGVEPKVENRGRPVSDKHIGQDVAIHAGMAWSIEGQADPRVRHAWRVFAEAIDLREPNQLLAAIGDTRTGYVGRLQPSPGLWMEQGAVVAVATLADCHPAAHDGSPGRTCCEPWGDAFHNGKPAYHLAWGNVRRLREPGVPTRGSLTVPWTLPADVAAQVEQQLAVAP